MFPPRGSLVEAASPALCSLECLRDATMSDDEWHRLIQALRATDDNDRAVVAAERLHKTAALEDLPRLMELLSDEDFFVREAAAWPISELAGPAALPELLVALQ